ncbi:trypsin-like serine protease [Candidatus Dojkabacteria bacterium]|uniref:Trypsin-like serine protease n=1 Tax=Candidatus Dojkabacteria bacterium TaxID=2099670 RepID=A0A955RM26_9BACT|nr:trypsin-like serine protease [Candidatus Dojkabacteria bacterium]
MIKDRLLYTIIFLLLGFLLLGSAALGFIVYSSSPSVTRDIPVLLNAETEQMYPETVFVFSQKVNGSTFLCGGSAIDSKHIITAAHCLADSVKIKIGASNQIILGSPLREIDSYYTESNWNNIGDKIIENADSLEAFTLYSDNDISIIKIKDSESEFTNIAKIGTISPDCGYELTAYGTTLEEINSNLKFPRLKESISVCLSYYNGKTVKITPESGTGICLGDSGSPIYKKDTNEVVAIVSMVLSDDSTQLCKINNIGLATVIGSHNAFIANHLDKEVVIAESVPELTNETNQETNTEGQSSEQNEESREELDKEIKMFLEQYQKQITEYKTADVENIEVSPTESNALTDDDITNDKISNSDLIQQNGQVVDINDTRNIDILNEEENNKTSSDTLISSSGNGDYIAIDIPTDLLILGSIIFSSLYAVLIVLIVVLIIRKRQKIKSVSTNQSSLLNKNFNNI